MRLTSRGRRQVTSSMFPGNYWVFRNLCLRIEDGGIETNQLPYTVLSQLLPGIVERLRNKSATEPGWNRFQNIREDRIELSEPVTVRANVSPTTWWCTSCHCLLNGPIGQVGINQGRCPNCGQKLLVQLASVFMCPECHEIEPLERISCNQCNDSRSVVLEGRGGRRREYRWRCTQHPDFEVYVHRLCRRDRSPMVLKSTGGRLYNIARVTEVRASILQNQDATEAGGLLFSSSHATVVDVVVGRRPIADFNAFYRGAEISPIEPFINPNTGNFIGFVSRLETDAIIIQPQQQGSYDNLTLHSIKHALLNSAPAVTGLTQDEFSADLKVDEGQIVFFDNVPGGTGGCRLLANRRLNRWLQVARELAECHQVQCNEACRGCLFLPSRICRQGNHDLDRHRVLELIS